ncbi:MAG: hypothetical protein EOO75_08730 [Myxococcales bacterium]|nr:MAG: hypothetical protein EOO75_08730 [Myxococcales bacterium]
MGACSVLRVAVLAAWSTAFSVLACGPTTAKPAGTAGGPGDPAATPAGGGADAASLKTDLAPAGPRKPSCADGSCFECGEGICPVGFFCETAGSATPACASSTTCAQRPTCACLGAQIKGCTCEDRGGVPHVKCDAPR